MDLVDIDTEFRAAWRMMANAAHRVSFDHGWWEDVKFGPIDMLAKLALMHSELGEATEAIRSDGVYTSKSTHIPMYTNLEEELADVVIRIMDFAQWYGLDIEGAIVSKTSFNDSRPYKHGKVA